MNTQDMRKMKIKQLRGRAKLLEPALRIGKNGLTDNVIQEIKKRLDKEKLIKIKMFGSFLEKKDKKELAKEIAQKTNSILIDRVGFVVVLLKKEKIN